VNLKNSNSDFPVLGRYVLISYMYIDVPTDCSAEGYYLLTYSMEQSPSWEANQ